MATLNDDQVGSILDRAAGTETHHFPDGGDEMACWAWALNGQLNCPKIWPTYLFDILGSHEDIPNYSNYFPTIITHGIQWYADNIMSIELMHRGLVENNWSDAVVASTFKLAIERICEANGLVLSNDDASVYKLFVTFDSTVNSPNWTHWGLEIMGKRVDTTPGNPLKYGNTTAVGAHGPNVLVIPLVGINDAQKQVLITI